MIETETTLHLQFSKHKCNKDVRRKQGNFPTHVHSLHTCYVQYIPFCILLSTDKPVGNTHLSKQKVINPMFQDRKTYPTYNISHAGKSGSTHRSI